MKSTLLALALCAELCGACPAQAAFYVDSVHGVDLIGGGSAAAPFKTLTFAVQQAAGTTGFVTFNLEPGNYSITSGESFPIVLPELCEVQADPATTVPAQHAVSITSPPGSTATFRIKPQRAAVVELRDLDFSGWQLNTLLIEQIGRSCTVRVERCVVSQPHCVTVTQSAGADLDLRITDSVLEGLEWPISIASQSGTSARLYVDRCLILRGIQAGIWLNARSGGTIVAELRACRIQGAWAAGILASTDNSALIATRIESCLIHDVGLIGSGTVGGIVDDIGPGGLTPRHQVYNSVFDNNAFDVPGAAVGRYTFGANLVQQPDLANYGQNWLGRATFVDPENGDFHLAPSSLGIDLGVSADVTLFVDFEGDPRQTLTSANPDLGPDEYYQHYLYAPFRARIGRTLTLRTTTTPSVQFGVVLATDRVPGSFGAGQVHLAGQIVATTLTGTAGTNGIGEVSFTIPPIAALSGLAFHWQAVYATAPHLGTNACTTVVP